jgi:hypothetical protein
MPTRDEMNRAGEPFLALRRPEAIKVDASAARIAELEGALVALVQRCEVLDGLLDEQRRISKRLAASLDLLKKSVAEEQIAANTPPRTLVWDLPAAPGQPVLWRWLRS